MKRLVVLLVGGWTAVSLLGAETSAPVSSEVALKQRATAIAKEAFSELSSNLLAAMARSGLKEALPYCSDKAIPITKGVAARNDVGLSRVTHKPRNPANKASAAELALLRQFQSELAAKRSPAPVLVTNSPPSAAVYVPIVISTPLCLSCHGKPGTEISADLHTVIRRLYPDDQATGFAMDDLRGLWRVDFPAQPQERK
jgi:hypothetical protein